MEASIIQYLFNTSQCLTYGIVLFFILFPAGIVLLKLSLDSPTFSNFSKCVCVAFSCLLVALGAFIFGLSFAGTILIDAHLY